MKKFTLAVMLLAAFAACQKQDEIASSNLQNQEPISTKQIDEFVYATIKQTNKPFEWQVTSDEMLWSALTQSEKILSVGFQAPNLGYKVLVSPLNVLHSQPAAR